MAIFYNLLLSGEIKNFCLSTIKWFPFRGGGGKFMWGLTKLNKDDIEPDYYEWMTLILEGEISNVLCL